MHFILMIALVERKYEHAKATILKPTVRRKYGFRWQPGFGEEVVAGFTVQEWESFDVRVVEVERDYE